MSTQQFQGRVEMLDVLDLKGNTLEGNVRRVKNITSATYAPTHGESGTIFTLNLSSGITITLPEPKVGLVYEFQIGTTFTAALTINTHGATKAQLQGLVMQSPSLLATRSNAGNTTGFAGPAAADHQYVADAATKGWLLGTHLVYKCVSSSKWSVSGACVTIGATVTPFT